MSTNQLCLSKVYASHLQEVEEFQRQVEAKIAPLETQLWKLYAELMDYDYLNTDKQDDFLQVKNYLNIQLQAAPTPPRPNSLPLVQVEPPASADTKLGEQLREAFADLIQSKQAKPAPSKPSSSQDPKKKMGKPPVQTISEQLQGMRSVQLRNDIFEKIQREVLPSNRLQHPYDHRQVNQVITVSVFSLVLLL